MTPRPTADTITEAELDALYRKIEIAEKAADGQSTFKWYADDAQRRLKVQRERAEQAEAAIDRIRARHTRGPNGCCADCSLNYWPCPTICLLDGPPCGPECEEWHAPAEQPGPAATEATGPRDCPPSDVGVEHTELRERCEAAVRMILAGTGAHTVDEWAQYVTAAVLPIFTSRIIKLTRERDLAIAHDRQPYPTAWAYEQACTALHAHRDRATVLREKVTALRDDVAGITGARYIADSLTSILDQTKEQPMPTTGPTPCTATISGPNVPDDGPIQCNREASHPGHHAGARPEYSEILWTDHHAGATPHAAAGE